VTLPLLFGALVAVPAPALAQSSGDGFLFRTPKVQITMRLGYAGASAGSEIFDFSREELTLDQRDFSGGFFGAEVAFRASERLDFVAAFSNASTRTRSEFRDWIGEDDLPIEQETTFTRRPFTFSARYYLGDRGRSVSRFAWVPNRVTPYLGAGVGVMWYEFVQDGDFVDFQDLAIFNTRFMSDGTSAMAQALGGFEWSLSPRVIANVEGRYEWASAELSQDFVDFDDIDLSGFQVSVGLGIRF
jgi:opacity protein-like surface antigen